MSKTKELKIILRQYPGEAPFDWCATLPDYDPENDDPRGYGNTCEQAVTALMEIIECRDLTVLDSIK